jgi:predicted glycogen debranching enzyme
MMAKAEIAVVELGREICGDADHAMRKEWLVTNGIGGYAMGTIGGPLTRRYHGLLIAAMKPPLGRRLLLSKLDETVHYAGETYALFHNVWSSGVMEPGGYRFLERFSLDGAIPVWRYAIGDGLLEKRLWMAPGENTTYVTYRLRRGVDRCEFSIKVLVNHRDHHHLTPEDHPPLQLDPVEKGIRLENGLESERLFVLSDRGEMDLLGEWFGGFQLSREEYRGLDHVDNHYYAAALNVSLEPGEGFTVVASTDRSPQMKGEDAYQERKKYEGALIGQLPHRQPPPWIRQLILAADQFVVSRRLDDEGTGRSIIAGYPWFADWGRDTMISLPGIALATGRAGLAEQILRTFARFVNRGMIPNRFPEAGTEPEYNTVDATLWYFEALRAYHADTQDADLVEELYPVLEGIVSWHERGTRYGIQVDASDGLLRAGEVGVQLTWMDAKVDDWVVTPRIGKPIEINALWYNALRTMEAFARLLGLPVDDYRYKAERVESSFGRFWNPDLGFCYDVLDGPDGDDPTLRPNQILAVSLPLSPLPGAHQKAVLEVCGRRLLTSFGLRSLAPQESDYHGAYGGGPRERDGAYHQGTAWAWLIGPYLSAHLRVYGDPDLTASYLQPLRHHLEDHGLGTISEIFDGNPPHHPRGCIAQAWSVAEILRLWREIQQWESQVS